MGARNTKAIYLDVSTAGVRPDGDAIRIQVQGQADQFVPLGRIDRAIVRGNDNAILDACLAIVARGGTVHFQGGDGRMAAVLQHAEPADNQSARELAGIIDQHDGLGPFHWWRDAQRRHAWSQVFRRTIQGDYQSGYKRLTSYLGLMAPGVPIHQECEQLEGLLQAWIQAELNRQGYHVIVRSLAGRGGDLIDVLRQCLSLPNCWAYVRWRRTQPNAISRCEIIRFFELRSVSALPEQLNRHMRALAGEYNSSSNRILTHRE